MHQGIVRVAVCFFAKFGFLYIFCAWTFSLISMCVLMSYLTSSNSSSSSRQPVVPSSPDSAKRMPSVNARHLKLASNLKHLQQSPVGSPGAATPDDLNLLVFAHKYDISPTCDRNAFLNIFITSAPRNFKQRSAIRNTWCSQNMTSVASIDNRIIPKHVTRCIFLLGRSLSLRIQEAVRSEASRHRDILQGFYLDSYQNLTLKVLQGFIWSYESCPSSYALKTDDDCFINVPVLNLLLDGASPGRNMYVGHVMDDKARRKVIRDPDSKWHVSSSQYSPWYYPEYASGFGYVLSWDVVELIASVYQSVRVIQVEDAYVGILLRSVGITPAHSDRFNVHSIQWHLCNLLYFVVIHRVSTETQSLLASQCIRSYLECSISSKHAFVWD